MVDFSILKYFFAGSGILLFLFMAAVQMSSTAEQVYESGSAMEGLKIIGGKLLGLDIELGRVTDKMMTSYATGDYPREQRISDYEYSLSMLALYLSLFVILYWILSWLSGIAQANPGTTLIIFAFIALLYFTLEYFYSSFVLNDPSIPIIDGVWKYLSNFVELTRIAFRT